MRVCSLSLSPSHRCHQCILCHPSHRCHQCIVYQFRFPLFDCWSTWWINYYLTPYTGMQEDRWSTPDRFWECYFYKSTSLATSLCNLYLYFKLPFAFLSTIFQFSLFSSTTLFINQLFFVSFVLFPFYFYFILSIFISFPSFSYFCSSSTTLRGYFYFQFILFIYILFSSFFYFCIPIPLIFNFPFTLFDIFFSSYFFDFLHYFSSSTLIFSFYPSTTDQFSFFPSSTTLFWFSFYSLWFIFFVYLFYILHYFSLLI